MSKGKSKAPAKKAPANNRPAKKETSAKGVKSKGFSMTHPYKQVTENKAFGGPKKSMKKVVARGSMTDSHFDKGGLLALNKNSKD